MGQGLFGCGRIKTRRLSQGRGAVGVNILCAIEGYDTAVQAAVAGGAQLIVSGAGLPLNLPGLVGTADVALTWNGAVPFSSYSSSISTP